jgi:LEA14-like dessication related protein
MNKTYQMDKKRNVLEARRAVKYFAIAAMLLLFSTCETLKELVKEPAVSFNSVSLTGLSFDGASMLAKINIQNGNSVSIPFPELDWEFFIKESSFLNGTVKNDKKIAANSTTVVDIPFNVPYKGLYDTVTGLLNANEAPYKVKLGARFPIPGIESKTFSNEFSGSIPLLKAPSLSFGGVKFNTVNLSKVEFVLNFAVENKNIFAINLDKLDYNFAVNNTTWAQGSAPQKYSIPAGKKSQVPVTVTVNSLSLLKDIATLAATGKTANYSCGGETSISPDSGFANFAALKLPFNYSGTTNLK